ncbi:unnamed protein product [Rotaria sp. Silwood1]|nr:unnamed protein product [Rotaria sp. Silwood1]
MNEANTLTNTIVNGNSNYNIIKESPTSSVISWTTKDVEQWLESLNLSKFVDKFCKENGIDGLTLLLMKEDDLKQSPLSIERLCDIKKLWYHIRLLQCKHNDFYSHINDDTKKHNHSSLSPTHLLETSLHNVNSSCQINFKEKPVFKTLKGEKRKTFASFIYALIIGIWTSFVMVVVHNRVPNVQKYPPLPDLFLDNIPHISWAFAVSEFLIVVMGTTFLLILMFHKYCGSSSTSKYASKHNRSTSDNASQNDQATGATLTYINRPIATIQLVTEEQLIQPNVDEHNEYKTEDEQSPKKEFNDDKKTMINNTDVNENGPPKVTSTNTESIK